MSVVLVVEDEHMLRSYTVRALQKLAEVEVVGAANYAEASEHLRQSRPSVLVSDIGLPDQNALGLLTELDDAGMDIPIIFVSAYLGEYRDRIPNRTGIEVFEKPVSMSVLRDAVERLLIDSRGARRAPFSLAEYLQLAAMGKHSVIIRVARAGEQLGWVRLLRGDLWSAQAGQLVGEQAIRALVFLEGVRIEVEAFEGVGDARQIRRPIEGILLDAFRQEDESRRNQRAPRRTVPLAPQPPEPEVEPSPPALPPLPRSSPAKRLSARPLDGPLPALNRRPEPPPPPDDGFAAQMEEGLDALLSRDYHMAWVAFSQAQAIRPDHPVVRANLARIQQMGHAPDD